MILSKRARVLGFIGFVVKKLSPEDAQQLVLDHTRFLYKGARSMGFTTIDAQDLVQDVWATFFAKEESFERKSKISTFLYGILINKCKERWRTNSKITDCDASHYDELFEKNFDQKGHWINRPTTPHQFAEAISNVEAVEKCLEKVPPMQKVAFTLRDVEDQDIVDITSILKTSTANVHVLLFRARAALRECLEREFLIRRGQ